MKMPGAAVNIIVNAVVVDKYCGSFIEVILEMSSTYTEYSIARVISSERRYCLKFMLCNA